MRQLLAEGSLSPLSSSHTHTPDPHTRTKLDAAVAAAAEAAMEAGWRAGRRAGATTTAVRRVPARPQRPQPAASGRLSLSLSLTLQKKREWARCSPDRHAPHTHTLTHHAALPD